MSDDAQIDGDLKGETIQPVPLAGWIMRVLQDATLAADWVLWVDIDTVLLDANFTLPFNEYVVGSHDLVLCVPFSISSSIFVVQFAG